MPNSDCSELKRRMKAQRKTKQDENAGDTEAVDAPPTSSDTKNKIKKEEEEINSNVNNDRIIDNIVLF